MKLARLPVRLGIGAALSAIVAVPFGAYAACPPGSTQQDTTMAANDKNGAGLPVTQNGTIAPGSTLGGIANDREIQTAKTSSSAVCN